MRVDLIQLELPEDETPARRLERVGELLNRCQGADLVLLPELWLPGYLSFSAYGTSATPVPGPLTAELGRLALAGRFHLLAGSLVEKTPTGLFNTALLFSPGGEVRASYRKVHLFGRHGSEEAELLAAGTHHGSAALPEGNLGLAICYDLRFPESFRLPTGPGPEAWAVVAAWPGSRLHDWEVLLRARAIENQAFLIGCNAARPFGGGSRVIDPHGRILALAGSGEEILSAEIHLSEATALRSQFPVWADRRPYPEASS